MSPRSVAGAVILAAALSLAACSSDAVPPEPAPGSEDLQLLLDAAIAAEASGRQIQVLTNAVRTGEIAFEDVSSLIEDTFACLDEAGIGYLRLAPEQVTPDFAIPNYSFAGTAPGMTETQVLALADQCIDTHSYFAEAALRSSSVAVEAKEERMRARLPEILQCLRGAGVQVDDDAPLDEVLTAVIELVIETHAAEEAGTGATVMCYDDFGAVSTPYN